MALHDDNNAHNIAYTFYFSFENTMLVVERWADGKRDFALSPPAFRGYPWTLAVKAVSHGVPPSIKICPSQKRKLPSEKGADVIELKDNAKITVIPFS